MAARFLGMLAACFAAAASARGAEKLVVHEWGTFTSLQDENGDAISGINTDDEPVPDFVHGISRWLLLPPSELPPVFFQGAPSCHPDVTMRLETPVLYFHCAKDFHARGNVRVAFRGGWLSQYFPDAAVDAPGVDAAKFGALTARTIGCLAWQNLEINADSATGPATSAPVWTSPRAAEAVDLKSESGEAEKFLFYRGVAHLNAPLRVSRRAGDGRGDLVIAADRRDPDGAQAARSIRRAWLADIRPNETAAFRMIDFSSKTEALSVEMPARFEEKAYSVDGIKTLRSEMRRALVAAGLFADEADALLNTWQLSYFQSSGLRLFFLVPDSWTNLYLPLEISPPCEVTRVTVGRVELVTPGQRALLKKIAAGPAPDPWKDFREPLERQTIRSGDNATWNALFSGEKSLAQIGFRVPELYGAYLALGRFRNALVLDEQKRRPTPALAEFIKRFRLEGYSVGN